MNDKKTISKSVRKRLAIQNPESICIHYIEQSGKCRMNKCQYNKHDELGNCTCKGINFVGSGKKKNHDYSSNGKYRI
ncbi:hypothetical protein KAR91_02455 [Candidatus Pacearchaeota archaeon]|nr:hypothetical protein [Candidatus Pacearchaeota archaeon]